MFSFLRKFDHRLWILAGGWVASSFGFSLALPFISLYFHSDLGLSLTAIGLYFGISALIRAVFQAYGGELADKLGRYSLMVASQLIRSVTFLFIAYAVAHHWGFYPVAGLLIFNSIFGALFQPAANATVADLVGREERTEAYAIVRVAGNLGWALGPAVGGFLAVNSYGVLFIFSSIMTFVSGLVVAFFLRGVGYMGTVQDKFRLRDILYLKGSELILKHAGLIFVLYLVVAQLIAPFSLYAVDLVGISKTQLGLLFSLNGMMVTFLQIPTTRILRKVKLTTQLSIGAAIYAVGYFSVGLVSTFAFFIVAFAVITMGENFISPPALSITANLAPQGRTGRYMGIYGFSVTAGWSLGPLLGGILLDWFKPHFVYSWGVIALIAVLSSIGFRMLTAKIPSQLNLSREFNK
jgi:MFS family permease